MGMADIGWPVLCRVYVKQINRPARQFVGYIGVKTVSGVKVVIRHAVVFK